MIKQYCDLFHNKEIIEIQYSVMKLSNLGIGNECVVTSVNVDKKTKHKLGSLGLTEGVKVTVVRVAPFGDPLEINLRGFYLAIRKSTLDLIEVEKTKMSDNK